MSATGTDPISTEVINTDPSAVDDRWISRKDAAALARCSQATIKRDEDKHKLDTREGVNGAVLVEIAGLVKIGRLQPQDVAPGASAADAADLRRATHRIEQLLVDASTVQGRLVERDALVEVLRQQLAEKDRQIKQLAGSLDGLVLALRSSRTSA